MKYLAILILLLGCHARVHIDSKPVPDSPIETSIKSPQIQDVMIKAGTQKVLRHPGEEFEDVEVEWILDEIKVAFFTHKTQKYRVDIFGELKELNELLKGKRVKVKGKIGTVSAYGKDVSITNATIEIIK